MTIVNLCDRCGKQCKHYGTDYEEVEIQQVSNKPQEVILCIPCWKILRNHINHFWGIEE